MAFFDDLGKKISQTSRDVVQKTKDTTEILKINSMISDEEKKMDNLFKEVGKMYFNLHRDSAEEGYEGYINAIIESQEKIADYKEKVNALKDVSTCPGCGEGIAKDALFCSSCGMKIEKPEPAIILESADDNNAKCPQCGAVVSDDSAFCIHCGTKIK